MKDLQIGEGVARPHVPELVINWHITEACNFSCRYCYAKWAGAGKELIHDWCRTKKMLKEVASFFAPGNLSNGLQESLTWSAVRLNLAGGEPLLYPDAVVRVLYKARNLGMNTSIITNGSRLTQELVAQIAPLLSMIGVSIDSDRISTNRGIGRVNSRGVGLGNQDLATLLDSARALNPTLCIKMNTVVNALNSDEDMSRAIDVIKPNRWKVLRMLPVITSDLAVTSKAFDTFVARHGQYKSIACVEDNGGMSESYLMIDPLGRFFQNGHEQQGYGYSEPIDIYGSSQAFRGWRFAAKSFASRYSHAFTESVSENLKRCS